MDPGSPKVRSTGIEWARWLFSQATSNGVPHVRAMRSVSASTPCAAPPSPTKLMATRSLPSRREAQAAPAAQGTPPATMAFSPRKPEAMSCRCIEPPLPPEEPCFRPNNSATMTAGLMPLATAWPWPRWVDVTRSVGRRQPITPAAAASCPIEEWNEPCILPAKCSDSMRVSSSRMRTMVS